MKIKIGGTTLELVQGDIVEQEVDAIVNAANNYLWMGSGVAGLIKMAGGESIELEATSQGPIAVGSAVVTGAGDLPCKYVIHAAGMGQDLATDAAKIGQATESALVLAMEKRLSSVAFPALGSGVGGFSIQSTANIMIETVMNFLLEKVDSGSAGLNLIRFVLFDDISFKAFRDEVSRRFSA